MSRLNWFQRLFWTEIRSLKGGFQMRQPRRWLARILHWGR